MALKNVVVSGGHQNLITTSGYRAIIVSSEITNYIGPVDTVVSVVDLMSGGATTTPVTTTNTSPYDYILLSYNNLGATELTRSIRVTWDDGGYKDFNVKLSPTDLNPVWGTATSGYTDYVSIDGCNSPFQGYRPFTANISYAGTTTTSTKIVNAVAGSNIPQGAFHYTVTIPDASFKDVSITSMSLAHGGPSAFITKGLIGEQHYETLSTFVASGWAGSTLLATTTDDGGAAFDSTVIDIDNQTRMYSTGSGITGNKAPWLHTHHYVNDTPNCPSPLSLCDDSANINWWAYTNTECDGTALPAALIANNLLLGTQGCSACDYYNDNTCTAADCYACSNLSIANSGLVTGVVTQHSCYIYGDITIDVSAATDSTGPIDVYIIPVPNTTINAGVTWTSTSGNDTIGYASITPIAGQIVIDETTSYTANNSIDPGVLTILNIESASTQNNTTVNYTGTPGLPLDAGSYVILLVDSNGCIWKKKPPYLVSTAPTITWSQVQAVPTCGSSDLDMSVTPLGPPANVAAATVTWTGPNGFTHTGTSIPSGIIDCSAPYIATITDVLAGCPPNPLTFNPVYCIPTATVTASPQVVTICETDTTPITFTAVGSVPNWSPSCGTGTYEWRGVGGTPLYSTNAVWGPNSWGSSSAGTYVYEVTYTESCSVSQGGSNCTAVDTVTVIVESRGCTNPVAINYDPAASCDDGSCILCSNLINVSSTTPITCYGGTDGTATVNTSGGSGNYTYSWNTTPVQTTQTIINLPPGALVCTIVDTTTGCYESVVAVVAGMPNISTVLQITHNTCNNNGSIQAIMGGGTGTFTWLWSTGATTQTINNLAAGTYTCQATDSNLCVGTLMTAVVLDNAVYGCTNAASSNYSVSATCDDGSCVVPGCTDDGLQSASWWSDPASNTTGIAYDVITGISTYPMAQPSNYNSLATIDDGSCVYPPAITGCCLTITGFGSGIITNCTLAHSSHLTCGWSGTITLLSQIHSVQFWDPTLNSGTGAWITTSSISVAAPSINSVVSWDYDCNAGGVLVDHFNNNSIDGEYRVVIVTTMGDGTICTAESATTYIDFPICGCTDPLATNYDVTSTCGTNTCLYPDPCTMSLTMTPNLCYQNSSVVTVSGGTGPFTYAWYTLQNPGVVTATGSTQHGWVESPIGSWTTIQGINVGFPFGGNGVSNNFYCVVTDTSNGCQETVGVWTPVYSPSTTSYMVHATVGDAMYCPSNGVPACCGSYQLYVGVTTPQVSILSVSVTGPNGYTSTLLADTGLDVGTYNFSALMSNNCTYSHYFDIYAAPQLEGCTDPTACNYDPMSACDDGTCFWLNLTATQPTCAVSTGSLTANIVTATGLPVDFHIYWTTPTGVNFSYQPLLPASSWPITESGLSTFGTYIVTVWTFQLGICTKTIDLIDPNLIQGCMDVLASNYNAAANCDCCCVYCNISITDTIICLDNSISQDGSINLVVIGTAPFTFSWTGPGGFTSTSQNIGSLTTAGTYTCIVTDALACSETYTGVIIDCTPYIAPTITSTITIDTSCQVSMQILTTGGGAIGPSQLYFIDSLGNSVAGNSSTGYSITQPNPQNTTFSIQCDVVGQLTNSITNSGPWNLVPGQTYTPAINYTFPTGITGTAVGLPMVVSMNAAMVCGCMDVAADNTNEDCSGNTVVPTCDVCCVTCNNTVVLGYAHGTCGNGTDVTATIGSGSGTYVWSGTLNGATSTTNIITGVIGTGPVTVTFTDAVTGCEHIDTLSFTDPQSQVTLGETHTCASNITEDNGTITTTIAPGNPVYIFLWTAANGGVVPVGQSTLQNLTALIPGDYTLVITDSLGCTDTITVIITNCCVTGCTDNINYAFNYDVTNICTCNSGAPNDCCVYPLPVATLTQGVTNCNNTISLSVTDTNTDALANTASATFQVIHDPAGVNTLLLTPLPVPPTGVDTYGFIFVEDCSNWWQSIDGDYAIQYVITYSNGHTETIISPTVSYTRRICGCTDTTATNYNAAATCDDGSCTYPGAITCTLSTLVFTAGCNETLTINASDSSSNTIASWQYDYLDPLSTVIYTGTATTTILVDSPLVDGACGPAVFGLLPNTTYTVVVTATYTNGTTATCTTAPITTTNFICGCTDVNSPNYTAGATCDDGSCTYPCCDTPILQATGNNVGACNLEWEATLNCNTPVTNNAETVVTTLQFWDGAAWQVSDVDTYNPTPGVNAITTRTVTYNYTCVSANTFGTYGTGDYRAVFDITYVGGSTCQLISTQNTITFGTCGCTDSSPGANPDIYGNDSAGLPCITPCGLGFAVTTYDPLAMCDDGSCITSSCCSPDTLIIDPNTPVCAPDLIFTATCNPVTVGHVMNWYKWDTGTAAWVLLTTITVAAANTSLTEILDNSFLHTTPGSEVYRAEAVITYSGTTCTIYLDYTYTPEPLGCMDSTPGLHPDINGESSLAIYDCAISSTIPTLSVPCVYPCTSGYTSSNYDPCVLCAGPCTITDYVHNWEKCGTSTIYTFVDIAQTGAGSESNDYWIAIGSPSNFANVINYATECYTYLGVGPTLGTIINYSPANYLLLATYNDCTSCDLNFHEWDLCVCPSAWSNPIAWADCAEDIVNMLGTPTSTYPLANTSFNNQIFYDYIVAQNGGPIAIGDVLTIRHASNAYEYCITYLGPHTGPASVHHGYTTMAGELELGNDFYFSGSADVYGDCSACALAPDLFLEWTKCGTTDIYNIVDVGAGVTALNTIAWVGINNNAAIIMPNATWGPTIGSTVIKLTGGDCFTFSGYNTIQAANATSELIDSTPTVTLELDCTSCLLVPGCTDPTASNYNFNCAGLPVVATLNDGCCVYINSGCMDDGLQTQAYWDGTEVWNGINSQSPNDYATLLNTVTYPTVPASNYSVTANLDDGTCDYLGCTDSTAGNYVSYATIDDGSCNYCVFGCTDPLYVQYNPLATCDCNSTDPDQGYTGPLDITLNNDCCIDLCVNGCMDCGTIWEAANPGLFCNGTTAATVAGSTNFNPLATCAVGCIAPLDGCTDLTALNYDSNANNDDGSCLYCSGFTTALGASLSGTGQAFVIDAASANTTTNWFQASLTTTIEDPSGSFTGTAILTMGLIPNVQLPTVLYIAVFDAVGNVSNSATVSSGVGTTFTTLGLGYGSYSMVISTISTPVWGVPQTCDNTFTFDIQTPACDDPAAFNTTVIPAQYVISTPALCIAPGFCACLVTPTTVVSTVCGTPSSITWNMICTPGTSITGFLEQSLDGGATWTTIVASITGTSNGFNTLLHTQLITTNSQWRFTYTETTTPSCGTAGTVVMPVIIITTIPICGCTDITAYNYNSLAVADDGSCIYCLYGCTDTLAANYDAVATCDDGSCLYSIEGCTDPGASNYSSGATIDDGSCMYCEAEYWDCIPSASTSINTCSSGVAVTLPIAEGILLSTNTYNSTELDPWTTFPNAEMALTSLVLLHGITATFSGFYYQSSQPCGTYPTGCCLNGFVKKKISSITHAGMPGQFFTTWKTYIDAAISAGVPTPSLISAPGTDGCDPVTGYNISIEGSTVSSTPSTATIISGALGSPSVNSDTINIVTCCVGRCNCSVVSVEGPNTSQASCMSDPLCCVS